MSAQKASAPVRIIRLAVAAILLVLAAAAMLTLLRERGGPRPEAVKPLPDDRVVDLKEQVRHEEYTDGKLRTEVRGANFFLGPDGRNNLKGSVEITGYGPAGEVVSRITADEVVYDTAAVRFGLTGRVRVEAGDVVLEGESFEYDKDRGLFRTASGGVFSSKTMMGRAAEVSYDESADEIRLEGGFSAHLFPSGRSGEAVSITGDSLLYRRRERQGHVDGRAELSSGRCRGEARSLSFTATEDESALGSAVFDGEARVVLVGNIKGGRQSGYVHADTIDVFFRRGSALVSTATAAGAVVFTIRSGTDPETLIHASAANLEFDADGELDRWSASGGFRAELDDPAGESRILEGESAEFEASTRVLRASGKPGRPAAAALPRARVEAASIVLGSAGDVEASGGVKCLLKPGEEGRAAGFFSPAKPVFVSGASLVYRGGTKSFSFAGEVQAWQDKEFLLAGELDLSEVSGEMRGRGGVAAGMAQAAAGETPERRIEVGGEDLIYSAAGRVLSFRKKSYVQMPGARLGAETIDAVLGREGRGVDTLTALTSVVVSKGRYEGRGDKAFYEAGADRITLTGRPVLIDKEGGSSRGDKLTFDLGDGKIRVENEGQGRSTIVVKS